jgi:hypothetical protein
MSDAVQQATEHPPFRRRLPNRRKGDAFEFDCDGTRYRAQLSYFEDGTLGEIFLNGPKVGSAASIAAHDAAVAASLALQHGCDPSTLHHACVKLTNGLSAGPVGRALDLMGDAP